MKKQPTYHSDLMRDLADHKAAVEYLNAAFEDKDYNVFLLALRDVAEAWGGMSKLSRKSKIPRISLYKMLSKRGNPEIHSLHLLLRSLGMRLAVLPSTGK